MNDGAKAWFEDRALVRQFPLRFRFLALYCRLICHRTSGMVRGGSLLQRMLVRATRMLRLSDTVSIRLGGATVFLDLLDSRIWWVLDEVGGGRAEHEVMRRSVSAGDTFVDVGANHGGYAVFASALTGSGGRVVAFEPQARLAGLVERSLTATAASPFEVHQVACGDRDQQVELFVPERGVGIGQPLRRLSVGAQSGRARAAGLARRRRRLAKLSWPRVPEAGCGGQRVGLPPRSRKDDSGPPATDPVRDQSG